MGQMTWGEQSIHSYNIHKIHTEFTVSMFTVSVDVVTMRP